jgi:hypothetical protein
LAAALVGHSNRAVGFSMGDCAFSPTPGRASEPNPFADAQTKNGEGPVVRGDGTAVT